MGYALTGHPIRTHKRRKQNTYCRCEDYEKETSRKSGRRRQTKRNRTSEEDVTVSRLKRPQSLQDLPVEVLQRIFVLSRDMTAMPSLNRYFLYHLKLSTYLLSEFLWEFYTFDYKSVGLGDDIDCPEGRVFLVDSVFDDATFYDFLRDHYDELSEHIQGYIPKHYVKERLDEEEKDLIVTVANGDESYDFPERFYSDFQEFFLQCDMMIHLSGFFSFERPYEAIEGFFQWLFRVLPGYIECYHQINEIISHIMIMAVVDEADRIESVDPLITLITELFDSQQPKALQLFLDELFDDDTSDTRIKLLESVLGRWYMVGEGRQCLSSPFLWTELRRISDMDLIETIEKFGGEPQYDMFF